MSGTRSYRWIALFAAFAALVGGMAMTLLSENRTARGFGVALFAGGAVAYVAARIAIFKKGR
jgi:hypothetical protein